MRLIFLYLASGLFWSWTWMFWALRRDSLTLFGIALLPAGPWLSVYVLWCAWRDRSSARGPVI